MAKARRGRGTDGQQAAKLALLKELSKPHPDAMKVDELERSLKTIATRQKAAEAAAEQRALAATGKGRIVVTSGTFLPPNATTKPNTSSIRLGDDATRSGSPFLKGGLPGLGRRK